jgi:hypothetical protein
MRAFKGVYKNGAVEFQEPFSLKDGTEVLVIPVMTGETNVDISTLLLQQETLKKIWEDEEDLYGEI